MNLLLTASPRWIGRITQQETGPLGTSLRQTGELGDIFRNGTFWNGWERDVWTHLRADRSPVDALGYGHDCTLYTVDRQHVLLI